MIFLIVSGKSFTTSWLAESAFPVILTFGKPNLFLKLSNHPLLALNLRLQNLHIPFTLSCHITTVFYLIILESIAMPFLQQSCTRIKAAFSIQDKTVLHKKCKVSAPAVIAAATASQISFFSFLFHNDSYSGLNYFEVVAICSCRPQSVVHMKQFTIFFFFVMSWLFSTSWEHFQHHQWHFIWIPWCYSGFTLLH